RPFGGDGLFAKLPPPLGSLLVRPGRGPFDPLVVQADHPFAEPHLEVFEDGDVLLDPVGAFGHAGRLGPSTAVRRGGAAGSRSISPPPPPSRRATARTYPRAQRESTGPRPPNHRARMSWR